MMNEKEVVTLFRKIFFVVLIITNQNKIILEMLLYSYREKKVIGTKLQFPLDISEIRQLYHK